MMGIAPSEAKRLSWWEYHALLWTWNDRHTPSEAVEVEAPDADYVARRQASLAHSGIARMIH